jgi:hypothetical protein
MIMLMLLPILALFLLKTWSCLRHCVRIGVVTFGDPFCTEISNGLRNDLRSLSHRVHRIYRFDDVSKLRVNRFLSFKFHALSYLGVIVDDLVKNFPPILYFVVDDLIHIFYFCLGNGLIP